ncbi:MAG: hypothetical protein ACYS5V_07815 [Planctomycetota bacterium]|jgi:hypothetical protein
MNVRQYGRSSACAQAAGLLAVAAICLPAAAQGTGPTEIEVVNEEYGFSFKVPARFEAIPPLSAGGPLHAFALIDDSARAGAVPTTIEIQKPLPGEGLQRVGKPGVSRALPRKAAGAQAETHTWRGLDLTAAYATLRMGDVSIRTVSVQIPLDPQPIVLTVMVDASRKDELDGYVAGILDSLQGQAATVSARPVPAGRGWAPGILLLLLAAAAAGLIVSVIVVVVIVVATRSKRSRPGPPTLPPSDPQ